MKKIFFLNLIGFVLFFSLAFSISAQAKTELIYFWGDGCPHCAKESEFLDAISKKYPELEIIKYEVWYNAENQKLFVETAKDLGITQLGVPLTIIGDKYFIGYQDDETTGKAIEERIKSALTSNGKPSGEVKTVKIPFFGEVDLLKMSLPVLTVILGTLDGFNPCAMWILVVFLSLLLPLKSRKKIALVGGVFILAEGLLYFIFMSAWLNFFLAVGYLSLIKIGIGAFGIIFGILRIRDFINWKPGVCKVTDAKSQGKIADKIQNVLKLSALPATIFGIIILAFSVNLIEFFCSAGFPTMYTNILSLQDVGTLRHYLYLVLYNIFYMLDDLIVFGFALFTLNRFNFSERYNRWSTLVAGILILILGILMIFKPALLTFG
jgi:thiol-disulfide isomerase/thioredoxin